jgi:Holliday junction resolvase RusA-like endonuclease
VSAANDFNCPQPSGESVAARDQSDRCQRGTPSEGERTRSDGQAGRADPNPATGVGHGCVSFTVYGVAAPAGSKTTGARKDGQRFVRDSSKRAAPWKQDVARAAAEAMNGDGLLDGPLQLTATFTVPRPKGHHGARGLRPSAPAHPTTRPDVTKLLRALEDA